VAVDWVRADLRHYQPEPGTFQLVLVAYLQLRAAELDGVLRKAVMALAPGGVLLVVGHDVTNLAEGVGGPPGSGRAVHARVHHALPQRPHRAAR
jgi:predicted methyltransferase